MNEDHGARKTLTGHSSCIQAMVTNGMPAPADIYILNVHSWKHLPCPKQSVPETNIPAVSLASILDHSYCS